MSKRKGGGSPTLGKVFKGGLCAGCGGCEAIAPDKVSMVTTDAGFARPVQHTDLTADEERVLERVCPGSRIDITDCEGTNHALWGPLLEMRSGHATDADMRFEASSGGGLSALLSFLVESGKVDFVLQTTASVADPVANRTVFTTDRAGIIAAAGSRYAPSSPLDGVAEALARPGRAAFVGKPCDVSALRALAAERPEVAEKFPYMLSFFCAGVPSLKGAGQILEQLGAAPDNVAAFRYRGRGWPGWAAAEMQDGSITRMSYADSWGGILSKHVQFRCKICPDGTGAHADVACADAWHCDERGYPLFEEQDGVSLIVSRTSRGEALVREAMAAGAIQTEMTPVEAVTPMQPGQTGKKRLVLSRLMAMALLFVPRPRYVGLNLGKVALQAGLGKNLHSFLGTCRRLFIGAHR